MRPGKKRGHPEVTLVGALAPVLDFASAEGRRSGDGRVLLVAGAGYQRCLSLPKCVLDPTAIAQGYLLP